MDDDKAHSMWLRTLSATLVLIAISFSGDAAICPAACRCMNEILKATCSSTSLQFVPIQLNPELHELDISNNKISELHFSLPFYENLVFLNLSHNRMKTLGNSNFIAQKNLTHLELNNNRLVHLTRESLLGLKALTHLNLNNNSLEEVHSQSFRELHSLMVLKLCGNRLVHLEEGLFRSCKNLRELYLDNNDFLVMPTVALTGTIHLRCLSLSGNLILSIEVGDMPNLPELQTLLLDSNVISDIHPDGLSNLVALNRLDLSNNNITQVPTVPLAKLSSLSMLRLSGNLIKSIPPVAFRGLFHLKVLQIDCLEMLTQIDARAFVDNINLQKIYMDYNFQMKELPTRLFRGNPRIEYVSVRFNNIHTLEAIHFPLDQLHELRVGGNPLNCNCSMGWLWQLIQEYEARSARINETKTEADEKKDGEFDLKLDASEISCAEPENLSGGLLAEATKGQMDCSVSWMAAVSVAVTVIFILLVIGGVVYWAPKRKSRSSKKEMSEMVETIGNNLPPPTPPRKSEPYHAAQVEKYVLPPPPTMIQNDYHRSMPPWDPYADSAVNIYEQLNQYRDRDRDRDRRDRGRGRDRAHLVYV